MFKIMPGRYSGFEIGSNGFMLAQLVIEDDGTQRVAVTEVVMWVSMLCVDMVTVKVPISMADLKYGQGVMTEEMLAELSEDKNRQLIEYSEKPRVHDGCLLRVTPPGTL